MSENASSPPQDIAAPTTSKDKRTLELEQLRKKQLAKSWQETKGNNGGNGGGNGGQPPMAMESWFQKQRAQTQENRQKQIDATEHLHKYRGLQGVESTVLSGNHVTIHDMKDELKRKEQEATALRHSYRGTPDAVLSHQVKKIHVSKGNNNNSSNDLTASASKSSFTDVVEHTSNNSTYSNTYEHGGIDFAKYNVEDGDEPVKIPKETELFSNDRKQSDATAVSVSDWELLSEKGRLSTAGSVSEISSAYMVTLNSSDSCSTSENNNKVNMDTLYVVPSGDGVDSELDTESLEKYTGLSSHSFHANEPDADAAAGPNIAASTGMKEDSISTSPPVDKEEEIAREWVTTNVSVSFGLLVLKDDAPQLGSYNAPVECKLLENILTKMRILAKQSLVQEIKSSNIMLADSDTNPVHIHVDNDGGYKVPASRPNTQRCLIKLSIPIKYVSEDHDAKTTAQSLVCGALRRALKSRAIV